VPAPAHPVPPWRRSDRILLLRDPAPNDVSSSAVRAELARGGPVRHLLPEAVRQYVYARGLYGAGRAGGGGGGRKEGAGVAA
jgi:nicotinic acid mononucleotide adenylyltransferase